MIPPTVQMKKLEAGRGRNLLELVAEPDPNPVPEPGLFTYNGLYLPEASRLMGRRIPMFLPWGGSHGAGIVPEPARRGQPFRVTQPFTQGGRPRHSSGPGSVHTPALR